VPVVFDFNQGAIVPVFSTVPETQQVAELTALNEAALPTLATLSTEAANAASTPVVPLVTPESGTVTVHVEAVVIDLATEGVPVQLAANETVEAVAADLLAGKDELIDAPQGLFSDAETGRGDNLTEMVSGLSQALERSRGELRQSVLGSGGMDGMQSALEMVFQTLGQGAGQALGDNGWEALPGVVSFTRPVLGAAGSILAISDPGWQAIGREMLRYVESTGSVIGTALQRHLAGEPSLTAPQSDGVPRGEPMPADDAPLLSEDPDLSLSVLDEWRHPEAEALAALMLLAGAWPPSRRREVAAPGSAG
jgi:hypothetical protein